MTIFVCSSLPPFPVEDDTIYSIVATEISPLNNGFMRMYALSFHAASILSIPATFATAFGFIYGYGRVILAMSRSGLFPAVLTRTYGEFKTPYVAIIVGSIISYAIVIVAYFFPILQTYLFNVCMMAGYTAYSSQLVGFLLFRVRHSDQERLYISPLGVCGAIYPLIVFNMSAISVMGFQSDNSIAFIIFLGIIVLSSIYYFSYAKSRQYFSVEEKFIFVMQIVKCKYAVITSIIIVVLIVILKILIDFLLSNRFFHSIFNFFLHSFFHAAAAFNCFLHILNYFFCIFYDLFQIMKGLGN